MKKFLIQLIVLLLVTIAALYYTFKGDVGTLPIPVNQTPKQNRLKINNTTISIEIADTASLRSKGLGDRDSLPNDAGMLFLFDEEKKYQFWMKNMHFPLDMIFIKDGKIVDILKNVPPPTQGQSDSSLPIYQPIVPIDMLLEVNAGYSDTNGVHVGDMIYLLDQ